MVEQYKAGAGRSHGRHNLIQLAAAHQRGGIRLRPALDQHGSNRRSGRPGQLLKLRQRGVKVHIHRHNLRCQRSDIAIEIEALARAHRSGRPRLRRHRRRPVLA